MNFAISSDWEFYFLGCQVFLFPENGWATGDAKLLICISLLRPLTPKMACNLIKNVESNTLLLSSYDRDSPDNVSEGERGEGEMVCSSSHDHSKEDLICSTHGGMSFSFTMSGESMLLSRLV